MHQGYSTNVYIDAQTFVLPLKLNPLNPTGLETGLPETHIYRKGRYTSPHTYYHYPAGRYTDQYYSGAQRAKINMRGGKGYYKDEWLGWSGFKGL